MPQLFPRRANTIARVVIVGGVLLVVAAGGAAFQWFWSPVVWQQEVPVEQPIPFSHQHHVGGLGIDCRFCHASVETARFAGMPPTETCMACHSQEWRDAPMLAPVRASWRENRPIRWVRVHDLPDYTYFDHHVHVAKGIGCVSCHGAVAEKPLMWKSETLAMRWCLQCHEHPEPARQNRDTHFAAPGPPATAPRPSRASRLSGAAPIDPTELKDCSICHR